MQVSHLLARVREKRPLIHHITNLVTISECANITLLAGGLPVMAFAREEAAEMVAHAAALVLNTGTLTADRVEAMLAAGRRANSLGLPVVLDPVGLGSTGMRSASVKLLLDELRIDIIKGNAAEIAQLAGSGGRIKGVESINACADTAGLAAALSAVTGAVVVVTGAKDLACDGESMVEVANGHPLMAKVVGTGCMLASLIGCFAAVTRERLQASVAALVALNVAAELAAQKAPTPAAFKVALFDELYALQEDTMIKRQKVTTRKIIP